MLTTITITITITHFTSIITNHITAAKISLIMTRITTKRIETTKVSTRLIDIIIIK